MPAKPPKEEFYWPLGAMDYASEISDHFPDEAAMLGIVTILWNRQEIALKRIFVDLLGTRRRAYARAIWDRQPTHQARRELIGLALDSVTMTKRRKAVLKWVLDRTKTVADRRNDLIHAEYVVHARTEKLHTKVKSPKSIKPPVHQKLDMGDLRVIVTDLEELLQATQAAWFELAPKSVTRLTSQLERFAKSHKPSP